MKSLILTATLLLLTTLTYAQGLSLDKTLFADQDILPFMSTTHHGDTITGHRSSDEEWDESALYLVVDNLSFLKDNEWDGDVVKGYTLPGLWIQPRAVYNPLENIHLEGGLHAIFYAGTIKYPTLMYQDLPMWKGDQYQSGTHILPFFRADIGLGEKLREPLSSDLTLNRVNQYPFHVVLGNIYGGAAHNLPDPLYSQELNLTADPEMGGQLIIDIPRLHFDTWINWQSFIYRGDFHKEAFCFGATADYTLRKPARPFCGIQYDLLFSALSQHVGGELDTLNGVSTHFNGSLGLQLKRKYRSKYVSQWSSALHLLGYSQNSSNKWPTEKFGWALYAEGRMLLNNGLGFKLAYMHNRTFQPLLGYNYYGTLGLGDYNNNPKQESIIRYRNPNLITAQVDWTKEFSKHYAFGLRAEAFAHFATPDNPLPTTPTHHNTFNISIGAYFRATPYFLLYKK